MSAREDRTGTEAPQGRRVAGAELERVLAGGKRSRLRRALVVVGLLAALPVAGYLIFGWGGGAARGSKAERYKTTLVERGTLRSTVSATGTLEALNTVEVGAEISGTILSVHVDFNDSVKKGQLLAVIDPEQYDAAVLEARARVRLANAGLSESGATLKQQRSAAERARGLAGRGLLSAGDLESALAQAQRASAAVESGHANLVLAKANLVAAQSRLKKTRVLSPIDGAVLSRKVEPGQTVNAGMQTPVLFVIAEDLTRMRLSASVDEADIGRVQTGQRATFSVDAYPDKRFASEVLAVRNLPNTEDSVVSYETLLRVDNPGLLLKPGMTATADITTRLQEGVLLVPNAALRFSPPDSIQRRRRGPPMPFMGRMGRGRRSGAKRSETGDEAGAGATRGAAARGGGSPGAADGAGAGPAAARGSGAGGGPRRGAAGGPPAGIRPGRPGGARVPAASLTGARGRKKDPRAGIIWVLHAGTPARRRVLKVGTDGARTAVESPRLSEGEQVVLDLLVDEG